MSPQDMAQRTESTSRVLEVEGSSCELPLGCPGVKGGADAEGTAKKVVKGGADAQGTAKKVVKGGADAQGTARRRKLEYLEYHRQRAKRMRAKNLGDTPDHAPVNESDIEIQEKNSSLSAQNQGDDTERKRKGKNEAEETLSAILHNREVKDVSCKEAHERRLVVSMFHDLVQGLKHQQQILDKEDDPKIIRVFDYASERLKSLCRNLCKNHIGSVPGVEVGNVFQSRRLLSLIGLHRPLGAGIYCLKPEESSHGVPLATSIVASGGYEDNIDNGDVIIYAGQSGKNDNRRKKQKQVYDQQLTPGNAALRNSWRKKQPVRLIRSCEDLSCGYRYDGLYNVEHCWLEKGRAGYLVYKFRLRRKGDQPPLVSHIVRFRAGPHGRKIAVMKEDIAEGRHKFSIPVVNSVDNVYIIDDFKYLLTVEYLCFFPKLELPEGCCCTGGCTDTESCLCARRNGAKFPYRTDGILIKPKTLVYECGPKCRCPPTCRNRVSQQGLNHKIEIFRTPRRDWGVRTLEFMQAGTFILEYTGNLYRSKRTSMNNFIFPISSITSEGNSGDLLGVVDNNSLSGSPFPIVQDKGFKVDASRSGNASRFIRRSSRPNVFAQYVLHDHHVKDIPHVMLFALENIPPNLELCLSSSGQQVVHSQATPWMKRLVRKYN